MSCANSEGDWGVLSPYLVPAGLRTRKAVNLGDGFILHAIERLLGRTFADVLLSPRIALAEKEIRTLERCRVVILAGANQLQDRYTIWPTFTAERFKRGTMRLVPFGIGLHGDERMTQHLTDETRSILDALHDRIEYSSWRCPRTVAFLQKELPSRTGQFLMTGCPVVYDLPLLEGKEFSSAEGSVAVTVTDRGEFWDRETQVIDAVVRRFPKSKRYFVVHQNFSPPDRWESLRHWADLPFSWRRMNPIEALRLYARQRGFQVVIPSSADECLRFYERVDVHVGSRLHAHLLFLSKNKRSFLTPVDERATGVSEHLGFPLLSPDNLERSWDSDIEVVRTRARASFDTMQRFIGSLRHVHHRESVSV